MTLVGYISGAMYQVKGGRERGAAASCASIQARGGDGLGRRVGRAGRLLMMLGYVLAREGLRSKDLDDN